MIARGVLLIAALVLAGGAARLPAPTGDALRVARALGTPTLRAQFRAIRSGWQRDTAACRRAVRCRARVTGRRTAFVAALAARISDANPTLLDLEAWALTGTWVAGPIVSLDGVERPYPLEDGIPEPGATLIARPGEWCAPVCATVGLEPGRLDNGDRAHAASLSLTPATPVLLAMHNGRAQFRAVAASDRVILLVTSCTTGMRDCGPASVTLTPRGRAILGPLPR